MTASRTACWATSPPSRSCRAGHSRATDDATVYHREDLSPGGSWTPCAPSLPAGARTRAEILALDAGSDPEAKLVCLRDLERPGVHDGIVGCKNAPCDPDMVVWAVLDHQLDVRHGPPDAPTRTAPGWSLLVRDAATGIVRSGLFSGLGLEPAFWGSLEDLAPNTITAEAHRQHRTGPGLTYQALGNLLLRAQ